jgi:hypothetical protein
LGHDLWIVVYLLVLEADLRSPAGTMTKLEVANDGKKYHHLEMTEIAMALAALIESGLAAQAPELEFLVSAHRWLVLGEPAGPGPSMSMKWDHSTVVIVTWARWGWIHIHMERSVAPKVAGSDYRDLRLAKAADMVVDLPISGLDVHLAILWTDSGP